MYKEKIDAYFDDPARRQELIRTVSRLVGVKSVKGEATRRPPLVPVPGRRWMRR